MKRKILVFSAVFLTHFVGATNVLVSSYAALNTAISGTADTIYIDGTIAVSNELSVNRNVVFIGINNAVLNGNNARRIISFSGANINISNLTFINGNTLQRGGAIGGYANNVKIVNSVFNNNSASEGGAIYFSSCQSVILEHSKFTNNTASSIGGAIWLSGASDLFVTNCLFDTNSAAGYTGGLDCHSVNREVIFNSQFTNNYAGSNDPAAICVGANYFYIINSTVVKNTSGGNAAGIGLYDNNREAHIYNCVIAGNTLHDGSVVDVGGIHSLDLHTIRMYNSVYQSIEGGLAVSQNNQSVISPAFVFTNYNNNDFTLSPYSSAVNKGSDAYYVSQWNAFFPSNTISSPEEHFDIKDTCRFKGCQIDIGAYESPYKKVFWGDSVKAEICDADTFVFAGKKLTNAGIYHDTLVTYHGCDSIIPLKLNVLRRDIVLVKDTAYKCEEYYFANDRLTETGIYHHTFTNVLGCDSIVTLDLLVRPKYFDDTLNVCAVALPVTIYDTVFDKNTISGVYTINHRCAVITMFLNIMPSPKAEQPIIPQICADDEEFMLIFPPSVAVNTKVPTTYSIAFNNSVFPAQNGKLTNNNDITSIVIPLPQPIYPDRYSCKITLSDSVYNCNSQVLDIQFDVYYPDTIMQQKWNDVLALLNKYYNGGFEFTGYQWYKNGVEMQGQTNSYIYAGRNSTYTGEVFSVLLTRLDGSKMFSCPFFFKPSNPDVSVFPSIMEAGSKVIIYTIADNAIIRIYTITGILISSVSANTPEIHITAPAIRGAYILEIIPENYEKQVNIIIVK